LSTANADGLALLLGDTTLDMSMYRRKIDTFWHHVDQVNKSRETDRLHAF
jgi:hypothetical protein